MIPCRYERSFPRVSQVLSVGKLYNPDVRYSFNIPIEDKPQQFFWDAYGPWQECSSLCQGEGEASGPGTVRRRVWSVMNCVVGAKMRGIVRGVVHGNTRVRGVGEERCLSGYT